VQLGKVLAIVVAGAVAQKMRQSQSWQLRLFVFCWRKHDKPASILHFLRRNEGNNSSGSQVFGPNEVVFVVVAAKQAKTRRREMSANKFRP